MALWAHNFLAEAIDIGVLSSICGNSIMESEDSVAQNCLDSLEGVPEYFNRLWADQIGTRPLWATPYS